MLKRFSYLIAGGLLLEALVFAGWYRDVLAVRRQLHEATASAASRDSFSRMADDVLSRPKVTRDTLERVAREAYVLRLTPTEVRALAAASRTSPDDVQLQLRLADALRRAGEYQKAESIYQSVLGTAGGSK